MRTSFNTDFTKDYDFKKIESAFKSISEKYQMEGDYIADDIKGFKICINFDVNEIANSNEEKDITNMISLYNLKNFQRYDLEKKLINNKKTIKNENFYKNIWRIM
jgi:hypothetical protein